MPKDIVIVADTRENIDVKFPTTLTWHEPSGASHRSRLHVIRRRLPTGDYAINNYEGLCVIERKQGISELYTNLRTNDYTRFSACLDRMSTIEVPILYLECNPRELCSPSKVTWRTPEGTRVETIEPQLIVDNLFQECAKRGIQIVCFPARPNPIEAGELVARLLWQQVYTSIFAPLPFRRNRNVSRIQDRIEVGSTATGSPGDGVVVCS